MSYLKYHTLIFIFLFSCSSTKNEIVKDDAGNILEKYEYIGDKILHGEYIRYGSDSKIKEKANYKKGILHGQRELYYDSGELEIRETYVDGIFSGPYYNYHKNGNISLEATYSNGILEGSLKRYYESGKILEDVTMVNNAENGPFKEYYENGNLEWEGTYLNGDNEFGLLINYDSTGVMIKKMMCDSLAICRTIWTLKDGDIVPKY